MILIVLLGIYLSGSNHDTYSATGHNISVAAIMILIVLLDIISQWQQS